jgi:uroporphyrinogen-III synthase
MTTHDLKGLRILNTRPLGQNQTLSQLIRAAGGHSIELPALAIEPLPFDHWPWLEQLETIDQMIFISVNAVRYFLDTLDKLRLILPASIRILAIGHTSASQLLKRQVRVDAVPMEATSEGLLQLDLMQDIENQTIVLVKGEQGRQLIMETLRSRGARVVPLDVYRRIIPRYNERFIQNLWKEDAIDVLLFTSEQAMHNLFALFETQAHDWLRKKTCVVISERLAASATQLGLKQIILSNYDQLLETLKKLRNE